jgi:NitT/TauT family transport system ATP-binding protein
LPESRPETGVPPGLVEPLPDVSPAEIIELLDYLHRCGDEETVVRIAADKNREFAHVVFIVKAAELLGFATTPLHMAALAPEGKRFVEATPDERRTLWRDRLLTLRLFREVYELLQRQPDHTVESDFVLETIVMSMPRENYERVFHTFIRWAHFGGLFVYDEATQRISLP